MIEERESAVSKMSSSSYLSIGRLKRDNDNDKKMIILNLSPAR